MPTTRQPQTSGLADGDSRGKKAFGQPGKKCTDSVFLMNSIENCLSNAEITNNTLLNIHIVQVQCCFTTTETLLTIRDGEPMTATSTDFHTAPEF